MSSSAASVAEPLCELVLATMAPGVAAWHHHAVRTRRTVLIVDDHAGFRHAARALLEAAGFEVVGEAADGSGALEGVGTLHPDIVVLDIQLATGLDGFDVAERLAETAQAPAVVLVSSRDADAYGPRLAEARALGFIPKSGLSGEALAALVE